MTHPIYANRKVEMDNFFKIFNLTRLTQEEAEILTKPVTEKGIKDIINSLKTNKSPGTYGISGEF